MSTSATFLQGRVPLPCEAMAHSPKWNQWRQTIKTRNTSIPKANKARNEVYVDISSKVNSVKLTAHTQQMMDMHYNIDAASE